MSIFISWPLKAEGCAEAGREGRRVGIAVAAEGVLPTRAAAEFGVSPRGGDGRRSRAAAPGTTAMR